jgi:hypothetical protein
MPRRQAQRVPETSTSRTYPLLLLKQDVRTRLQSMGALIMMETSSSADSYGLLTSNTAVGEEDVVVASPLAVGMEVTIYNPTFDDAERSAARALAQAVTAAFATIT